VSDENPSGEFALNLHWLKQLEEYNFGGREYFIRNGENSVYTNFGDDSTAIPIGLPVSFCDPLFQKKFRECVHLKKKFPDFDFSCSRVRDLSPALASDESFKKCYDKMKEAFRDRKKESKKRTYSTY